MKRCPRCGAAYDGHRWVPEPGPELIRKLERKKVYRQLCPGCLRLERGQVEGVVRLEGAFLEGHIEEIKHLVERVSRNGKHRNVAARVVRQAEEGGALTIETTDDHLAERIGKEMVKAFKGTLDIKWQEKDRFARVQWRRD